MTIAWLKRPGVAKAGRIAGYVTFGLVAFLVSVVLTVPTGRLRSFVENRLSTSTGMAIHVDDVSMRGLGSVALFGVHAELPAEKAPAAAPDGAAAPAPAPAKRGLSIDRLDVSFGLLRALFGGLSITASARSGDGVLGPVKVLKTKESLTVDVSEIKDFPIPAALAAFGVRFSGLLSGKGQVAWNLAEGIAGSTGRVELAATKVVAVKPTLKSEAQGSVTLTDVSLGKVTLVANLDKKSNIPEFKADRRNPGASETVIHLEKVEIDGADVKVVVTGQSTLRLFTGKGISDAQLNVDFAFSLSDSFFERSVNVGGEAQTPNRFIRTLLNLDPRWKSAQAGGYWGVMCTGTLARPSCTPKKPAIRGGDFKAPSKDEDKGATKGEAAKPASRPVESRPSSPGPAAPAAPAAPVPAPAPAAAPAVPAPAGEEPAASSRPEISAPPGGINGLRPVVPTVIGRPRARIKADDDPAPGPEGNGDSPPPSPAGEGTE